MQINMNKIILSIAITFIISITMAQNGKEIKDVKGLSVGTNAPFFSAIDSDSNTFVLNEALVNGPVVIIFYRGLWCPVCNKHLSQIQDSLKLITEKGAQVIAISAQKPEYLDKMTDKTGAKYTLLYDTGFKIADAYGVSFKPTATTLFTYNVVLNAKLKKSQTDNSQRLPIPATYIIGQNGKIVWRQFDPNYKNRSSIQDIVNNIP